MRVGVSQIRPYLGCLDKNVKIHQENVAYAKKEKVDVLVFPELSLTGYHLLDLTYQVALNMDAKPIQLIWDVSLDIDVVVGFVESSPSHVLYNAAAYGNSKGCLHLHRKVYLPTYGMFDEGRYFGRGQSVQSFGTRFGKVGLLICEDAWHVSTGYLLAQQGAEVLIVLSNSPVQGVNTKGPKSQETWCTILKTQALLHGMYVVFANRVGIEDGTTFYGGSMVIDPFGEVVTQASLFEEELLVVDLDLEKVKRARYQMPLQRDENIDLTMRELRRIQGVISR